MECLICDHFAFRREVFAKLSKTPRFPLHLFIQLQLQCQLIVNEDSEENAPNRAYLLGRNINQWVHSNPHECEIAALPADQ